MSQSTPKAKSGEKKPKKKKVKNTEMNADVMNMVSSFTVLRFCSMLGMRNVTFTKEELLAMNAKLNKIKKISK
jgi:maleate cis-trans isomerase